ncbi:hypothetical protein ECPA33_3739, partial [Escherichia coli PA33]
MYPYPIL